MGGPDDFQKMQQMSQNDPRRTGANGMRGPPPGHPDHRGPPPGGNPNNRGPPPGYQQPRGPPPGHPGAQQKPPPNSNLFGNPNPLGK